MMRTLVFACCAALAAGGAVSAQQPDRPQQQNQKQTPRESAPQRDRDMVTVTGCLSVNPAARMYILTVNPDTVGTAGGTGVVNGPTTINYQLVGGKGLEQRVGNTIEVTGRVDPRTKATAESRSERSGPPSNAQNTDKKPKVETKTETKIRTEVLRVESFRTLNATCKPTATSR